MKNWDNQHTSGGTGEDGVFIKSRENYHKTIGIDDIVPYVTPLCEHFGVDLPDKFQIRPKYKSYWGRYYPECAQRPFSMVVVCLPIPVGVLIHEVCHHIARVKYSCRGHGWHFKYVLGECLRIKGI